MSSESFTELQVVVKLDLDAAEAFASDWRGYSPIILADYARAAITIAHAIDAVMPKMVEVGCFVRATNHTVPYSQRMEVLAIRGDRVYAIDGDGDAIHYDITNLEVVE